jgi:hypothetical protein
MQSVSTCLSLLIAKNRENVAKCREAPPCYPAKNDDIPILWMGSPYTKSRETMPAEQGERPFHRLIAINRNREASNWSRVTDVAPRSARDH